VIPGGIRSRGDLVNSIADDPVVAVHYANFDLDQAKFVRSEEAQTVHVAYRLGNKVYWTAKTIKIPPGETLISDGNEVARTRCGNRISVLPQEPISEEEPEIETFEIPMIATAPPPKLDFSPPSELETRPIEPLIPNIPVQSLMIERLPYDTRRPLALFPPRVPEVPEPGTLTLMITGLAVLVAARFARKR
jgi:hypothetical protein